MAGQVDARLAELGITLPDLGAPGGNYVPYKIVGNLLFVSGQVPMADGKITGIGKCGKEYTAEEGATYARLCGLRLLTVAKEACGGDLDRIVQVVKLLGMVNSDPSFGEQPKVVNGCSDLLIEVLGEKGRHARSAVGMAGLPFDVAVEIEAIFEIA